MAPAVRFLVVILASLAGIVGAVSGLAVWGLRCFDTCPIDPAVELRTDAVIGGLAVFAIASFAGAILAARSPVLAGSLLLGAAAIAVIIAIASLPEWRALLVAAIPAAAGALAFRSPPKRARA
jgi:hypothetical protein